MENKGVLIHEKDISVPIHNHQKYMSMTRMYVYPTIPTSSWKILFYFTKLRTNFLASQETFLRLLYNHACPICVKDDLELLVHALCKQKTVVTPFSEWIDILSQYILHLPFKPIIFPLFTPLGLSNKRHCLLQYVSLVLTRHIDGPKTNPACPHRNLCQLAVGIGFNVEGLFKSEYGESSWCKDTPAGSEFYNGWCIWLVATGHNKSMSWEQANVKCQTSVTNGHLPKIDNRRMMSYIKQFVWKHYFPGIPSPLYLGLHFIVSILHN